MSIVNPANNALIGSVFFVTGNRLIAEQKWRCGQQVCDEASENLVSNHKVLLNQDPTDNKGSESLLF